ncbi:MAG TPA: hypothetical protein VF662_02750 [Allosphingosinicella sp.]
MTIICALAGHKASARTIWNEGTHFSKCARCDLDLVELQGRWEAPPPWFRIVWKPRPEPAEVPEETLELTELAVCAAPVREERSGGDRRVAGSDGPPPSLRVDRRRGRDRRKSAKRQAIVRA